MRKISSRTNSPYSAHYLKSVQQASIGLCKENEFEKALNSLYCPQQEVETQSPYIRRRIIPLSANRDRKSIKNNMNNSSYEQENINQAQQFSSQLDLSQTVASDCIKDCQKTPVIYTKLPQKQFVLKKIDLQKVYNYQKKNFDYTNTKESTQVIRQNSIEKSTKLTKIEDSVEKKKIVDADRICKIQHIFDNSQYTTDDQSEEIDLHESILQLIKIEENTDSHSFNQAQSKAKQLSGTEQINSDSDNESEEEYNIWPDNSEILMRGIDFENFTDNQNNPLLPQVLYKVRSIFYNQFQQINSSVTKQTKNCKLNQNACKQNFEYIPCDKKIQQDFQTLKEFADGLKKRKKYIQGRVVSPKKFKNHFVVQLEREKFFQNIQIHSNINQTPQFLNFLQHVKNFRKAEQMKQRPPKYSRYSINPSCNFETQQSVSKRIKSCQSNQGTPRNHNTTVRVKQSIPSIFSQFIKIDYSVQSSLNNAYVKEASINTSRCSSSIKKRNISSTNRSNNSNQIQKQRAQLNQGTPDYSSIKLRHVRDEPISILDEIIVNQKN